MNILRVALNINRNVITSFIIKICVTESAIPKREEKWGRGRRWETFPSTTPLKRTSFLYHTDLTFIEIVIDIWILNVLYEGFQKYLKGRMHEI